MGLWPISARRQAPDVRAGGRMSGRSREAGCPGHGPDVQAGEVGLGALWIGAPDFRAYGWMSGLSGSAGCPGLRAGCPGLVGTWRLGGCCG